MTDFFRKKYDNKAEQSNLNVIIFLDMLDYKLALENKEDFMEAVIRVTNRQYKRKTGKDYPEEKNIENRTNPNFFKVVEDAKISIAAVSFPYIDKISSHIKNKLREATYKEETEINVSLNSCSLEESEVLMDIGFIIAREDNTITIFW